MRAAQGEASAYFWDIVVNYDGNECLTWPYHCHRTGYGRVWHNGRMHIVSNLLCRVVNGPPPTPVHQAAHSCGKGHLACCAKRHLSWKTPKENDQDKIIHGTAHLGREEGFGGRFPANCKVTAEHVIKIRDLKGVYPMRIIAHQFGISTSQVSRIHLRENWADV